MAELFEKDGVPWIRESDGLEHEAGDMPVYIAPKPTTEEKLINLEQVVDTILTGGVTP